ncbi:MAG: glycosyltransferase [Desulfatirhabdiaceae bacterium]
MNISYSVIIPAYNEQAYLPATLHALQHAMSRSDMAGEIIVVNNNSHDKTADVAAEMGATVVFEPINQISRARNTGARATKGRYLIFLDADTLICPELLNTALGNLSSGSCCGGGGQVMFQGDLTGFARYGAKFWNWISSRFRLAAGCFIYCLKEGFDAVGGFSQRVYASEEIWFSRQLQAWGKEQGMDFRIITDPPLLTSDRKLQWFSPFQLIAFGIVFFIFPFAVRFRPLCAFWYARSAPRRGTDN